MDKKKILFVDDEPNILAGLKRMLRSMRKEFELYFSEKGADALTVMKEVDFDVVVSDMRMPGMDGAQLLTEIQERHPYVIRIMLTGQADEESVLRTVGVVHQFLAKPCDPDYLKGILRRASGLHELISHPAVKRIVSGIDTLPSVPEVYNKLRKAVVNPEVTVAQVGEIIEQDMGMSAKVLQLVNSAFFGLFQTVDSPARAVGLLGVDTVKGLVLGVGAFAEIKATSKVFPVGRLWGHSLAVGGCAKKIALAETDDKQLIDDCFIAGILHDIGKLVLLAKLMEKYEEAVHLAEQKSIRLRSAEKEVFEAVHGDIGAYLMGLWGMPGSVVEGIGFHHRLDNYPNTEFSPAIAVHVANTVYYETHPGEVIGAMPELAVNHLNRLGMEDKIEEWRGICVEYLEQQDD
jgi:HD-like signal output (HDOD) protein/ActR/RegA family two-component response regulator